MIETKFKQTEIGLIPEDWEKSSVGETFLHVNSNTLSRDCLNYESGIAQNVHYGDVLVKYGAFIDAEKDELPYINDDTGVTINPNVLLRSGDVIFADTAEDETAGKATELINVNSNIVAGLHTIVNRPKQDLFSQKYLGYYFNSSLYHNQLIPHMQGIKVLSLSKKAIDTTIVVYPKDKKEQKRIAEALSNIDQLIFSLSKIIEKKRLIKQGAMQQLLTGKKRLPGFDKEWVEYRLEDVINRFATGLNPRQNFTLNSSSSNNYYVTIKNFREGQLYLDDNCDKINDYALELINHRSNLRSGDVLMSSIGRIGDAYVIVSEPKNWNINESIFSLRPDYSKITSLFLYYTIKSDLLQKQIKGGSTGSTLTSIKMSHLKELLCYIPTSMEEQSAITNILSTMDNEIESLKEEREKYIRLKEGMMQKLLSGQIRLINTEAKPIVQPKEKVANVYFRRSVLAAEIADRLCEERTFGHVKMEKLIFLTEHLCHVDIDSHYHRDAAGPYDNRALRSIDSQMKKQKWFEAKKEDKGYRYLPLQNRGGHKKYFEKYYADVMPMFEKIIDTFKTSPTEQCEIVATLYSAWDDLLQNHQPFTDDDILNEVLNNWNETKKRIKRSRWQAALDWMRANGFVPQNDNR